MKWFRFVSFSLSLSFLLSLLPFRHHFLLFQIVHLTFFCFWNSTFKRKLARSKHARAHKTWKQKPKPKDKPKHTHTKYKKSGAFSLCYFNLNSAQVLLAYKYMRYHWIYWILLLLWFLCFELVALNRLSLGSTKQTHIISLMSTFPLPIAPSIVEL